MVMLNVISSRLSEPRQNGPRTCQTATSTMITTCRAGCCPMSVGLLCLFNTVYSVAKITQS